MKKLEVKALSKQYPIFFDVDNEAHMIDQFASILEDKHMADQQILILTDKKIDRIYHDFIQSFADRIGADILVIPQGENQKSNQRAMKIYTWLLEHKYTRNAVLIALGGGVIGDLTGYVASSYLRGVRFIQIPTTLLAQVDSSVGGKVAINHPLSKNSIGAFYQPEFVYIHLPFLLTLSRKDYLSGFAEAMKYGHILDAGFTDYLTENRKKILRRDMTVLQEIVSRSCAFKASVVEEDETEKGVRAILNLGHTLGHGFEILSHFKIKHGIAIAMGTVFAFYLAAELNCCDKALYREIYQAYRQFGIFRDIPAFDADQLISVLKNDKKNHREGITFVLPLEVGKVEIVRDLPCDMVKDLLCKFCKEEL